MLCHKLHCGLGCTSPSLACCIESIVCELGFTLNIMQRDTDQFKSASNYFITLKCINGGYHSDVPLDNILHVPHSCLLIRKALSKSKQTKLVIKSKMDIDLFLINLVIKTHSLKPTSFDHILF